MPVERDKTDAVTPNARRDSRGTDSKFALKHVGFRLEEV